MSLENSIATLTEQVSLVLDSASRVEAAATAQINKVGAAYSSRLAAMSTTFYVDQLLGNDANEGTQASPLKTINRAVALTPPGGGICTTNLLSDYHVDADINLSGRKLIVGRVGVTRKLTFAKYTLDPGTNVTYRAVRGFVSDGRFCHVALSGLNVELPEAVANEIGLPESTYPAIFKEQWALAPGAGIFEFYNCSVSVPLERYGPLCGFSGATFISLVTTFGGARGHIRGRVFSGVTDEAGVDPKTLNLLRSNLTLV